jgi:hypothetical protein
METELKNPRLIASHQAGDLPECSVASLRIGIGKIGVIQEVQRFDTELK